MRCSITFLASATKHVSFSIIKEWSYESKAALPEHWQLRSDNGTPRIQITSSAPIVCVHPSAQQESTGGPCSGTKYEHSRRTIRDLSNASYLKNSFKLHLHYLQKISDVKFSDVLFRTFNFRTLIPSFRTIFGQKCRTLRWNMPKVNLRLKKHELDWNKICETDSFTVPSAIKMEFIYVFVFRKRNIYFPLQW